MLINYFKMNSKLLIFLLFIGIGSINSSIVKIESFDTLDNLIEIDNLDVDEGKRVPHIDIEKLEFIKQKKVKIGENEFDQLTCDNYKIDQNLCSKYEADKIVCTNLNYKKEKWHKFNCEITEAKSKDKKIIIKNQFISCTMIEAEHITGPCVLRYYLKMNQA